jgi:hypothetical protein
VVLVQVVTTDNPKQSSLGTVSGVPAISYIDVATNTLYVGYSWDSDGTSWALEGVDLLFDTVRALRCAGTPGVPPALWSVLGARACA